MQQLLEQGGFRGLRAWIGEYGRYVACPPAFMKPWEILMHGLAPHFRRRVARSVCFRSLLTIRMTARKPGVA
jgi:hypothetical protein